MGPPGAVGGRVPPVIPFHGHIVSPRLCPTGLLGLLSYDAAWTGSKRPSCRCHLAQSLSTLQCSRKNSGSFAAVGMLEIAPPKLTCAEPCGFPSKFRNLRYWFPRASVCASVSRPGGAVEVLNSGRRLM